MIINYWHNLNERERWMLGIGLISTLLYLFYTLVYSPLVTAVDNKTRQLLEKKETVAWMQSIRKQPTNKTTAQTINSAKLLALIGEQLKQNHFRPFPYQLQQTGAGDIQLSFERVPFNQFLSWLWSLSQSYAISLKQLTAERTDRPGVVKLMVVIAAK